MRNCVFLVYFVLCSLVPAFAQIAAEPPSGTQQWQLTFDVIKAKVDALVRENARLTAEAQSLKAQEQKLYVTIGEQGQKNEAIRQFLKERKGRTDQQIRMEELAGQVKTKKAQ